MPLVVYGSSGHGKVVCDVLLSAGLVVDGFLDDNADTHGTTVLGLPVLGGGAWLSGRSARVALGIGDNRARARVAAACESRGAELVTCVHPRAAVAKSAVLGPGTIVMALAAINPDARIGRGVIVNTASVVEHDCVVGDFAHVSPNSVMGGECRVGAFAQLGIGGTMLPRTSIGEGTLVGAGGVVVRDIPDNAVAHGVPARVTRRA
jgi:sugar O-acyltransferase (sialic acid O-acetyltransferase NeuD family)